MNEFEWTPVDHIEPLEIGNKVLDELKKEIQSEFDENSCVKSYSSLDNIIDAYKRALDRGNKTDLNGAEIDQLYQTLKRLQDLSRMIVLKKEEKEDISFQIISIIS